MLPLTSGPGKRILALGHSTQLFCINDNDKNNFSTHRRDIASFYFMYNRSKKFSFFSHFSRHHKYDAYSCINSYDALYFIKLCSEINIRIIHILGNEIRLVIFWKYSSKVTKCSVIIFFFLNQENSKRDRRQGAGS